MNTRLIYSIVYDIIYSVKNRKGCGYIEIHNGNKIIY